MTIRRVAIVIALMVMNTACVQTNAVRLGPSPARTPVAAAAVAIYRTAEQVPGPYEEVALLNSTGNSSWTDEAKMIESMRKKAGQLGANAVILNAIQEPSAGAKVAGAFLGTPVERKGQSVAIFIFPDSTQVRARR